MTFSRKKIFSLLLGVLIVVALFALVKCYVRPQYLQWSFARSLAEQPLFAVIQKTHPQEYAAFIEKAKKNLRSEEDEKAIAFEAALLMDRIFYQHLSQTSDEAIQANLKATLDLYRYLYTKDPQTILLFENGNLISSVNVNALWNDATFQSLLAQVLETKTQIIEAPGAPIPNTTQATSLLDTVLGQLNQKFTPTTVRAVFEKPNTIPSETAAGVIMGFYTEILATGKENAGIIMRHLAAKKIQASNSAKGV